MLIKVAGSELAKQTQQTGKPRHCPFDLNQNSKHTDGSHSSAKLVEKKVLVMSLKCTLVTQLILCLIFLMCVRTIQRLNDGGHTHKKKREKKSFFVILTHLRPSDKVKVIKPGMKW